MGLDVNFYAVKKHEVDSFRKINFLLNYFDINDESNAKDIEISEEAFGNFVAELRCELAQHKDLNDCFDEPINPVFRNKEVYLGGSTAYDQIYWDNLTEVYHWANNLLRSFDWENNILVINA